MNLTFSLVMAACLGFPVLAADRWQRPAPADARRVELGGAWGRNQARGLARLQQEPFTTPFVLADVNFGMKRWFTNYSGDISGRFLEVEAATLPPGQPPGKVVREEIDALPGCQQPDGHFGVPIDWQKPIDFSEKDTEAAMMPTLWGNGRLLLGLLAAHERLGDPRLLAAARKLGNFYVDTVANRFCDPQRTNEYHRPAAYAGAYVTCVYQGLEGLLRLYRTTHDARYLNTARRMADFHAAFDTLPVDHSHGSLSVHGALLMLYEETGDSRYLARVTARWDAAVRQGYISPVGGVLEKFWITGFNRDEGCSEADWLRLNLALWRHTGETRYLDMAERTMGCEYPANQWASGGYGHRFFGVDAQGPYAFLKYSQESLWCCSFHAPLAVHDLKGFLALGQPGSILYHFPVDFQAPVQVGATEWTVTSRMLPPQPGKPVRTSVTLATAKAARIPLWVRVPEWADQVEVLAAGKALAGIVRNGYLQTAPIAANTEFELAYHAQPRLENRRCSPLPIPPLPARLENVVLRHGPYVLVNADRGEIQEITLTVDAQGAIRLPAADAPVKLAPWHEVAHPEAPHAFVFHVRLEKAP